MLNQCMQQDILVLKIQHNGKFQLYEKALLLLKAINIWRIVIINSLKMSQRDLTVFE